jgi:hypothetical protein
LWAFYRIRKLRKYLLFIVPPSFISNLFQALFFGDLDTNYELGILTWFLPTIDFTYPGFIFSLVSWFIFGLSIYLVVIWSRQHNKQFDRKAAQPAQS